jgi:hypothetical protein
MIDLSKTIQAKSDQLNADDLMGISKTIKVTKVSLLEGEQPISIHYEGDEGKPFKPCKSMRRVLVRVWGNDGNAFVGKSMTVYRDDNVTFGGAAVGGIRISHMSGIDEPVVMSLTATRKSKKPFTVKPLIESKAKSTDSKIPDATLDKILKFGEEAAHKGVAAYSEWLSKLDAKVKEQIKPKHKEWSAIAREADKPKEEEIPL